MTAPASVVASSRRVLVRHARSFRLASIFLPREASDEAAITYAFCREADDMADEAPDLATARASLSDLDAELTGEVPPRLLVAAYLEVARSRSIPVEAAQELLQGLRSDLKPVCVADDGELMRYCYRVAGTVGLMMCGVLGVTSPEARAPAVDLGLAMQLTNICRDVLEDAGRGRVYIPASRLAKVGLTPEDVLDPTLPRDLDRRARLATVVRDLLEVAEGAYTRAWRGMHHIPPRPRVAIHVAAVVYRSIGRRLLSLHQADPIHGRTIVPRFRRWVGVGWGLLSALHPVSWGLGDSAGPSPLHVHLRGLGGAPSYVVS